MPDATTEVIHLKDLWKEKKSGPLSWGLTSSTNAVVPKFGSAAYDVTKTAPNHLIRELAVGLAPPVRVNGIAPSAGSTMFSRDRVMQSLPVDGGLQEAFLR